MLKLKKFIIGWMLPPKLFLAYLRFRGVLSNGSQWGPLDQAGEQVEPDKTNPSSLQDLQTALPGDIVWVPIDKIRTGAAMAMTMVQHPYIRYFREGKSSLERFFSLSQPKNSFEHCFVAAPRENVGRAQETSRMRHCFRKYPWSQVFTPLPFQSSWAGPADKSRVECEASMLNEVERSIDRHGMWMGKQKTEPSYWLLINDESEPFEDFRVVVHGGNHRVAYLAHLEWTLVPVSPSVQHCAVRLSDLDRWPGVLDGSFTFQEARILFLAFFRDPDLLLLDEW